MPVAQVHHLQRMIQQPLSLHSPVGESEDNLADFVADLSIQTPLEIIGAWQSR